MIVKVKYKDKEGSTNEVTYREISKWEIKDRLLNLYRKSGTNETVKACYNMEYVLWVWEVE